MRSSLRHRLFCVTALVAALAAPACERRQVEGDTRGERVWTARLPPDAAARPASDSGTDTGGGNGASGGGNGATGGAGGAPGGSGGAGGSTSLDGPAAPPADAAPEAGPPLAGCNKCQTRMCSNHPDYGDVAKICSDPTNTKVVGEGPAAGMLFTAACGAVLECVRRTSCAAQPPNYPLERCFCGTADPATTDCITGKANGACKREIEQASGTVDPAEVMIGLLSPFARDGFQNAAAYAMTLLGCMQDLCGSACFSYNSCGTDFERQDMMRGNPFCERPECKAEGQCASQELCVSAGFCKADP